MLPLRLHKSITPVLCMSAVVEPHPTPQKEIMNRSRAGLSLEEVSRPARPLDIPYVLVPVCMYVIMHVCMFHMKVEEHARNTSVCVCVRLRLRAADAHKLSLSNTHI